MRTRSWVRLAERREPGFTLIELVVVLAIIAILVAAAVPLYLSARMKAYKAEAATVLQELKTLEWGYYQQYSAFTNALASLGFQPPASQNWAYTSPTVGGGAVTMSAVGSTGSPVANQSMTVMLSSDGSVSTAATF